MATETSLLEADEAVTVDLFGTDVRPPRLFGVGEADPALWTLLDAVPGPASWPSGRPRATADSPAASPTSPS